MTVSIYQAKESDWEIIRDLNQSSFTANKSFDPYLDMRWVYSQKAKKYFLTALSDPTYHTLLAEIGNKPAGYLILGPKQYDYRIARMIELQNMAVLPQYRSKGIGEKLVTEAKIWAKRNGFQTIYVNSYLRNKRAVRFYKSQGFVPIDISLETGL